MLRVKRKIRGEIAITRLKLNSTKIAKAKQTICNAFSTHVIAIKNNGKKKKFALIVPRSNQRCMFERRPLLITLPSQDNVLR